MMTTMIIKAILCVIQIICMVAVIVKKRSWPLLIQFLIACIAAIL